MSRLGLSIRACALGASLAVAVLVGPATAASHEGSLFDGKKDISARVYDRNDAALERFWNEVDGVLGSRVGHESEDNHDITAVDIEVGAVALTDAERTGLEAAAPPFVDLKVFRTKYSFDDLEEFGARAHSILSEEWPHGPGGGFGYRDVPDRITIHLIREDPWASEILRRHLPDDVFRVDVSAPIQILPLIPQPREVVKRWTAALAALVLGAAVLGLRRLRATPSVEPAH